MTQDEKVQFTWTLESEQADERYDQLGVIGIETHKVDLGTSEQLLPLAAVAAAPAIAYVAPIILAGTSSLAVLCGVVIGIIKSKEPGLIIDVRGGKLDMFENKNIPHHVIMVVTSKGVEEIDLRKDPRFQGAISDNVLATIIQNAQKEESSQEGENAQEGESAPEGENAENAEQDGNNDGEISKQ